MKTIDWTRDELVAYILLFVANSDFKEEEKERKLIRSKVDRTTFQDIHSEFDNDNDYRSIKKIKTSLEQHNYQDDDIDLLLTDIKTLFFSIKEFNTVERDMLKAMNRLFKTL